MEIVEDTSEAVWERPIGGRSSDARAGPEVGESNRADAALGNLGDGGVSNPLRWFPTTGMRALRSLVSEFTPSREGTTIVHAQSLRWPNHTSKGA